MEEKEKKKPINTMDNWWVKSIFVDDNLDVWKRGKYVGTTAELREAGEQIEDTPTSKMTGNEPKKQTEKDEEISLLRKSLESNAKLAEMVTELIKNQSNGKDTELLAKALIEFQNASSGVTPKYGHGKIDDDDILPKEEYVTYYAPGIAYLILDYYNEVGVPVKSPYGRMLRFDYAGTKRAKNQKEERDTNFCTITIMSRKEVAWIEKHPMYDLMFFRKSNKAFDTNSMIATRAMEYYKKISEWDRTRIMDEANTRGIKFSPEDGLDVLVKNIATNIILDVIKEEQIKIAEGIKRNSIEEMLKAKPQ